MFHFKKIKKRYIVLGLFTLMIILIHLFLPTIILNHLNRVLANLDGYKGHIEDVDIHLYRGAYIIKNLNVVYTKGNMPTPFLEVDQIDVSIHWKALFRGRIVSEFIFEQPVLNFMINNTGSEQQTGKENNWGETISKLTPLNIQINLLAINNGKIFFKDFSKSPQVEVFLKELNLRATNLSNVKDTQAKLPSKLNLTAKSIGNGDLKLEAKLNVLKKIPDFDIDWSLENIDLKFLNEFTTAYANFDFEEGTLSVFSEVLMENAHYDGYTKVLFEHMKILHLKKEKDGILQTMWEGVLQVVTEIFENQKRDQFASKVPFEGDLKDTNINVWITITTILKNAFIEALPKEIDESISSK